MCFHYQHQLQYTLDCCKYSTISTLAEFNLGNFNRLFDADFEVTVTKLTVISTQQLETEFKRGRPLYDNIGQLFV